MPATGLPTRYHKVFSLLKGVRGGPRRWDAFCPAHDDRKRSLGLALGSDERLLIRCHAPRHCPTEVILNTLGLGFDDLFSGTRMATRTIEVTYPYQDEQGELLYEVVRYRPKEFSVRRPGREGEESWVWKMDGVRKVLYNLPAIMKTKGPVFFCEGERSANRLIKLGLTATTSPSGAGNFHHVRDQARLVLAGRKVAVFADDDPLDFRLGYSPGLRHAFQVCQSLKDVSACVKLVRCFNVGHKQDVDDYLDQYKYLGKQTERQMLLELLQQTSEWTGEELLPVRSQLPDNVFVARLAQRHEKLLTKLTCQPMDDQASGMLLRCYNAVQQALQQGNQETKLQALADLGAAVVACGSVIVREEELE